MKVRHKYVKGATGALVNRANWNDDHDITDVAIADIPGLQAALDGKDASGTANAAIVAHRNETDPHTQYTTAAEASAAAPVQSVAGQAGAITASALKAALGITTSDVSGNLDGSRITGIIPISAMPAGALDRLVIVANQAARYALTVATVQTGDTVKDDDTGLLWFVVDDTKLDQPAGYSAYTAGQASSVSWSGVTGLPTALQAGGTAGQYVAGNMTLQTLNAAAVGLGNVNNTSDANKPVSAAQQAALDTKAPLASPVLTGTVSVETLNFSGGARRIIGDFSNANFAQRTVFQTSAEAAVTSVGAIPNGAGWGSSYIAHGSSDPSNSQFVQLMCIGGISTSIRSRYTGTPASGTFLPLQLCTSDVIRQEILPTGEVGIGVTPQVGKGTLQVPDINGAATSGFKNKIINGCMRISKKGIGAALLGNNRFGADGITTIIGGWSAISGFTIRQGSDVQDTRMTSTGSLHYCSLGTVTGAGGYITYSHNIEAADAQELAGRVVTLSCRLTAVGTAIANHYLRIYKADAKDNFSVLTQVACSPSLGAISIDQVMPVVFTTTLSAADCMNGLYVDVVSEYTGAVAASSHNFLGDFSLRASSQLEPFELRPIAIEEQLRRRYYRKQSVWVGVAGARTCFPIDMAKTPTITGGGTGFTSAGTTADTLMCYQTTAAAQTLTLDAEL